MIRHILQNWHSYLNLLMMLIGAISSLRAFRLDMPKIYKHFSYYLWFIFIADSFGYAWPRVLYKLLGLPQPNLWLYNSLYLISVIFYAYFFHAILHNKKARNIIKVSGLSYFLFAITNITLLQGPTTLNTYSILLGSMLIMFASISYYYQILQSKEIIVLRKDPIFWISTGTLAFYLSSMLSFFLLRAASQISPDKATSLHNIILTLSSVMYPLFIIAHLCYRKRS